MSSIQLKCSAGDTVYIILERMTGGYDLFESKVDIVQYFCNNNSAECLYRVCFPYKTENIRNFDYKLRDFGNKIFTDLEKAKNKPDKLNTSHYYLGGGDE